MTKEDAYSLFTQGKELLKANKPIQAAKLLERAKKIQPAKGSIREALGRAYYNYQKYDLARREFARAIEIDPTNHYAYFGLGLSFKKLNDLKGACKNLKIALAMDPNNQDYKEAWQKMGQRARIRSLELVEEKSPINVKCYSGYKGEQAPRSFDLKGEWHEVVHVEKTWYEEDEKTRERKTLYRALTSKGSLFDISYNEKKDVWLLEREMKH